MKTLSMTFAVGWWVGWLVGGAAYAGDLGVDGLVALAVLAAVPVGVLGARCDWGAR